MRQMALNLLGDSFCRKRFVFLRRIFSSKKTLYFLELTHTHPEIHSDGLRSSKDLRWHFKIAVIKCRELRHKFPKDFL